MEPLKTMDNPRAFDAAVEALVAMGEPAVPCLLQRLDDPDTHIRRGCAAALLRIDREIGLPPVRERLAHSDRGFGISMAHAMVRTNVEAGLAVQVMIENLSDTYYPVYNESIKVLGELGPQSTEAVPVLVEHLRKAEHADIRSRLAHALARIGPGASAAVPALGEALGDPDADVREAAAYALSTVGPAAREAEHALRLALNDADPKVRFRASKALQKLR
jgi:HEAT repeat protein